MQAMERRYTAFGVGAALVMAALILGYRVLFSDPYAGAHTSSDEANHHPQSATAADQPGVSE